MTEDRAANTPSEPEDPGFRYKVARSFQLSFAGAGVSVIVALFTFEVARFCIDAQTGNVSSWEWFWSPPVFVLTLICFFRLYWLDWNTLSYLWPIDSFRWYVNDVGAYFAGCFWLLLMRYPWFWAIAAAVLFFLCFRRVYWVYKDGPLYPRSRQSIEWRIFANRYESYHKDHWAIVAIYALVSIFNFCLWIFLVKLDKCPSVYYSYVIPVVFLVLVPLGTFMNWSRRVACPFFPVKQETRGDRET